MFLGEEASLRKTLSIDVLAFSHKAGHLCVDGLHAVRSLYLECVLILFLFYGANLQGGFIRPLLAHGTPEEVYSPLYKLEQEELSIRLRLDTVYVDTRIYVCMRSFSPCCLLVFLSVFPKRSVLSVSLSKPCGC